MPREAVAAGLHRHLIRAEMRLGRQLRALPRLEIQHVRPLGRALRQRQLPRLLDGGRVEAEGGVALLRACDGLENEVGGRAGLDGAHLRRHMGQHADLRGDAVAAAHLVKARQHAADALGRVARGVQADDGVARAEAQALEQGGENAVDVIRRVVRLQAARQRARQADGRVAVGRDRNLARGIDEIKIAHELTDGGDHLAREAARGAAEVGRRRGLAQNPLTQVRDGPVLHLRIDALVQVVLNDARDLVLLIGHGGVLAQVAQQQLRQHGLGGDALLRALGGQPGEPVAGFRLVCLGKHVLHIAEGIGLAEQQRLQLQMVPFFQIRSDSIENI